MIIADRLVCNYTEAIFNVSTDKIDIIQSQIAELNDLINQLKKAYNQRFFNENIGKQVLIKAVQKLGFSNIVVNLLIQLVQNNRLDILPSICQYLPVFILNKAGVCQVDVRSIAPINSQEINEITDYVKSHVKKDISIKNIIDDSLLGGLIVSFDTFLLDTCLITRLNNVKKLCI